MNPYEDQSVVVNPYRVDPVLPRDPYEDTSVKNLYTRDSAYVVSKGGFGGGFVETYRDLELRPIRQGIQEAINAYASEQVFVVDEFLKEALAHGDPRSLPAARQQYQELDEALDNPDTYHEAVATELVAGAPTEVRLEFDDEQFIERVKNAQILEYGAAKMAMQGDMVDKVGLLLNDQALDAAKVLDPSIGGFLNIEDRLRKWHRQYNTLSPSEQREWIRDMIPKIQEATGNNPIKTAEFLNFLNSPEEDLNLWLDKIFLVMDTLDASKISVALSVGTVGLARAAIATKKMEKFRRMADATDLNATIAAGKRGVAEMFGGNIEEANTASLPFEQVRVYPDGLPTDINKEMRGYSEALNYARSLQKQEQLITGGLGLKPREVQEVFEREKRRLADSPGVQKVTPVKFDQEGITYEVTYANTELQLATELQAKGLPEVAKKQILTKGPPGYKETVKYKFTQDDITGDFETKTLEPLGVRLYASPNFVFGKDRDLLVKPATRGMLQREKASGMYAKLIREAQTDAIKSKQTVQINQALKETEELEVPALDYDDLVGRHQLNERAIQSYYKHRELAETGYHMKDAEVKSRMEQQGVKYINSPQLGGAHKQFLGRPYEDLRAATSGLQGSNTAYIYKIDTNTAVKNTPDALKQHYDQDYVLVRNRESIADHAGDAYTFTFVKREAVNELPDNVLHYVPGYLPRINKDANYFIDEITRGTLNGVPNQIIARRTVGGYSTKINADTSVERLRSAEFPPKPGRDYQVRFDREYDTVDLENNARMFSGGLFTGARKREPLLVDNAIAETEAPIASLARYYQTLARNGTLEPWRLGVEKRWLNTANNIRGNKESAIRPGYQDDFWHAIENLKPGLQPREQIALEELHQYIRQQTGMFAANELKSRQWLRSFYEALETKKFPGAKRLAKGVLNLSGKDAPGFMRAFAFHPLLGMYSPAQLVVQASGSLLPLSKHPVAFNKGAFKMFQTVARDLGKEGARKATKGKEIDNFYQHWRESGLMDSVNAHADLALLARGTGGTWDKIFNELDNATVFFRMGEYWNRLAAFGTSYELFKAANKRLPDINRAEDLQQVIDKSFDLMMNLSTANKAKWQEGWLGTLFQFQQIQAKVLEDLFGKHVSTAEKIGMFGVQAAMFGARGFPLATQLVNYMDRFVEIGDLTEDQAVGIRRGLSAMLWNMYAQQDIDFQGRLSVANVQFDALTRLIANKDLADAMTSGAFGPGVQAVAKTTDAFHPLWVAGTSAKWSDVAISASKLASISSSVRGAIAEYRYWSYGRIFDTKMREVDYRPEDKRNWVESRMLASGFQSADFPERYDALNYIRGRKEQISMAVKETIAAVRMGYVDEVYNREAFARQSSYLKGLTETFTPAESLSYIRAVAKGIENELTETEVEKAYDTITKWAFTGKGGGTQPFIIRGAKIGE